MTNEVPTGSPRWVWRVRAAAGHVLSFGACDTEDDARIKALAHAKGVDGAKVEVVAAPPYGVTGAFALGVDD
jgi:hypothetical protein